MDDDDDDDDDEDDDDEDDDDDDDLQTSVCDERDGIVDASGDAANSIDDIPII